VFLFGHWPLVLDTVVRIGLDALHDARVLFTTAIFMWMSVCGPDRGVAPVRSRPR